MIQAKFESNHRHLGTFPNVFVYLMDQDTPICYWRGNCTDFKNPDAPLLWYYFENDPAINKAKKVEFTGMFSMRLYFHETSNLNKEFDYQKYPIWKGKTKNRANVYKLRAYIYQAEQLPAMDETGASDVFIDFWNAEGK